MSLDPGLHRRRSTRLRARDYSSPGDYFVTLCAHERQMLFGDVVDGVMRLNDLGRAADRFWNEIPLHFPFVELDEHVVMPNHVHGIIRIVNRPHPTQLPIVCVIGKPIVPGMWIPGGNTPDVGVNVLDVGANNHSPLQFHNRITQNTEIPRWNPRGTSRTIGSMIRGFKIGVTGWFRTQRWIGPVWQRNYHDHIIRNERSLERIRAYIRSKPANWGRDRNNPDRKSAP